MTQSDVHFRKIMQGAVWRKNYRAKSGSKDPMR